MSSYSDDRPPTPIEKFWELGPLKCGAIIGGAIAWFVLKSWLSGKVHWPEAYGVERCTRLGDRGACYLVYLTYSPKLLFHPNVYSVGLFIQFWTVPIFFCGVAYHYWKQRVRGARYSQGEGVE